MLQSLDLSENKLLSLPDETGELKNLNDLTLSQNCLEVLPHSIGLTTTVLLFLFTIVTVLNHFQAN